MRLFLLFFILIFSTKTFAFDLGDGSLGACTEASIVASGRIFNCSSLTLAGGGTTFTSGGSAVIIKVLGSVTINSSFTLSGAIGQNGTNAVGANIAGGQPGPGGFAGGSYTGASTSGSSGLGSGGGGKGTNIIAGSGLNGGGGAGGSHGTSGVDGNPGDSVAGVATGIIAGVFSGGSGGGTGGTGPDSGFTVNSPGAGGGGGGAIKIIAGGTITVSGAGSIISNGGKGGNGNTTSAPGGSGGGGGGAGGLIVLQSLTGITLTGTVSLNGGALGVGAGANGGAGGLGRLELHTPAMANIDYASATLNGITPSIFDLNQNEFNGDFTTSCGSIIGPNDGEGGGGASFLLNFLLGFLLILIAFRKNRAKTILS